MSWQFDYQSGDLVFTSISFGSIVDGVTSFGDEVGSDLELDCGDRDNETSEVDMGSRVIEGAF